MKISINDWSTGVILGIIAGIFLVTRLYLISSQPPSLYWDEASIGYNAYSILKTGRDEWGQLLPVHFRAFNEFKLPVYIYSVSLSEAIFGNTILAVRIPAVLFSLGSMFLIFYISELLFGRRSISLINSFLFTIVPWIFIFSRTGYEVCAGLFFFLLGCYSLLRIKESGWFILTAIGSLICAMYSYNAFRIVVPIFSIYYFLYLCFTKQVFWLIKNESKKIFLGFIILIIGILPILNLYFSDGGLKRFSDQSVFSNTFDGWKLVSLNYLKHFSPQFLFLEGDQNIRSHTGNVGELYWIQFLLIVAGLFYAFKFKKSAAVFLIGLLLIGPIPAAITRDSPHALRSLLMMVPLVLLSGAGLVYLNDKFKSKQFGYAIFVAIFCLLFAVYFGKYINYYDTVVSDSWQYGYKEAFTKYGKEFDNYDYVLVSDRYVQPYIFYLEYLSVDPKYYLANRILNKEPRVETSLVKQIGKVEFGEVHFADFPKGNSLVFAHPSERLTEIIPNDVLLNPDKTVAFYVYEYRK